MQRMCFFVGALVIGLAAPAAFGADEQPAADIGTPGAKDALLAPEADVAPMQRGTSFTALGRALSDDTLAAHRGGADLHINDMDLKGTVADNSADHLKTGDNYITTGAFSNTAGFPMTVQNSGNNVLIQSATIINLTVQ